MTPDGQRKISLITRVTGFHTAARRPTKVLLPGKNGQVGLELQRALAPLGEVVALDFDSARPLQANFSRREPLATTVAPSAHP